MMVITGVSLQYFTVMGLVCQKFLHLQKPKKSVLIGAVLGRIFKPSNSTERALNPNWRHRPPNPYIFCPLKYKVDTII